MSAFPPCGVFEVTELYMDGDDRDIVQEFIQTRSEAAFAELVRRHINLVYASALRHMKEPADAEDVTQDVFVLLARHASRIHDGEAVGGWLLTTTRFVSLNALRTKARRRRLEREAADMIQHRSPDEASPMEGSIDSLLDDALNRLRRVDRDLVTFRYLQGLSVADVAKSMGISPDAAQKRLGRVLEKLRASYAARGVHTSTEAMSAALLASVQAPVPAALTEQITHIAMTTAAKVSAAPSVGGLKGALFLMTGTKTNIAIVTVAIAALLGMGAGMAYHVSRPVPQVAMATAAATIPTPEPPAAPIDWHPAFNAAYSLDPGQFVKRLEPPFIPERDLHFRERNPNARNAPEMMTIYWQNGRANDRIVGGTLRLSELLIHIAGVFPQDVDIPRQLLANRPIGDWIYDKDATPEQLAAAVLRQVPEIVGAGMTLRPEKIERDTIVASGQFRLTPLPQASKSALPDPLLAFHGDTPDRNGYGVPGSPEQVLQFLGAMLVRPMVVEADLSNTGLKRANFLYMDVSKSANFLDAVDPPDDAIVEEVLANVSKQTGLEFKHERRTVTIWKLVKAGP